MSIAIRTACVVVAALGSLPAAASAATVLTTYDVTVEGTGSYSHVAAEPGYSDTSEATFSFVTRLPELTFVDNTPAGSVAASTTVTVDSARKTTVQTTESGVDRDSCAAASGTQIAAPPGHVRGAYGPRPTGAAGVDLAVSGTFDIPLPQCEPAPRQWSIRLNEQDAFTQFFSFPHEAVGFGKVIQLVERTTTGAGCPGNLRQNTTSCTLSWKATVTFVRTKVTVAEGEPTDDDLVVPLPGNGSPHPAGERASLARASLSRDARRAAVTLSCPTGCKAVVSATPLRRAGARKARALTLARKRVTVAAGRSKRVTLRLGRRARAVARKAGGVRILVAVSPRGGGKPSRHTTTLRLPRR